MAKNIQHQNELQQALMLRGVNSVFLIGKDQYLNLTPVTGTPYQVVITTPYHSEGYNMTAYRVLIQGVYFSNEATREQLEKRINRLDQTAPQVRIITIHAGIISYIHQHYEKVHSLSKAISGFASSIGDAELSVSDL